MSAQQQQPEQPQWRGLVEIPIIAVLAVVIVVVLRAVLVQPFYIPSASMEPQLQINDKILVSRLSYRFHSVQRGDIVVFSEPKGVVLRGAGTSGPIGWITSRLGLAPRTDVLVKRVIGLPGDTVEGREGHVYVNNHLLLEPYLPIDDGHMTSNFAAVVVPKGRLFVMGDNRGDSEDSRIFGPIKKSTVVGRVLVKVWPLDNISFL